MGNVALINLDEALAPFEAVDQEAVRRYQRMGVMDEKGTYYEVTLNILAAAFASNFYDCFSDKQTGYRGSHRHFEDIHATICNLWEGKEVKSLYFYVLLQCSLINYAIPKELKWIAMSNEALTSFMYNFQEVLNNIAQNKNPLEKSKEV